MKENKDPEDDLDVNDDQAEADDIGPILQVCAYLTIRLPRLLKNDVQ